METSVPFRRSCVLRFKGLTGPELCAVLNRQDLARLLGTQGELVSGASGSESRSALLSTVTPEAKVELDTYSVHLSAYEDDRLVKEDVPLLGSDARRATVAGHPAVLYSSRTMKIRFGPGVTSGPVEQGSPVRSLVVARDAEDSGGSFEILWRQDGMVPDVEVLRQVAEKVLPEVPGWSSEPTAPRD